MASVKSLISLFDNKNERLFGNIEAMRSDHLQLTKETGKLTNALTNPTAVGMWGEMQLQRVVEIAG